MKITKQWGIDRNVCSLGLDWFETNKELDDIGIIKKLMSENKFKWANWVLTHLMSYNEFSLYAIYIIEQVINYEEGYPKEILYLLKDYLNSPSLDKKKIIEDKFSNFVSGSAIQNVVSFAAKAIIFNDYKYACTSALYASIAYVKYNYKHDILPNNTVNRSHEDVYVDTPHNNIKRKMDIQILNYGLNLIKERDES